MVISNYCMVFVMFLIILRERHYQVIKIKLNHFTFLTVLGLFFKQQSFFIQRLYFQRKRSVQPCVLYSLSCPSHLNNKKENKNLDVISKHFVQQEHYRMTTKYFLNVYYCKHTTDFKTIKYNANTKQLTKFTKCAFQYISYML